MKLFKALSILLLAASASAQQYSFTNVVNTGIPDANANGLYSTITVSNIFGTITNVTVYLDVDGEWNGDLFSYVTFDNGGYAVLLNRVGKSDSNPVGYTNTGFQITLDDSAATDVHAYGGGLNPVTGTWQPDGRETDPQLVVDTDPRTAFLSSFNTLDPNGVWTFFIADMAVGFDNTLVEWRLNLYVVPEPNHAAFAALAVTALIISRRRRQY